MDRNKMNTNRVSEILNDFGFDNEGFCESMTHQHRTLQQCFTRLCFAWIKYVATHDYGTDDRNQATKVKCTAIYEKVKNDPAWDFLPYI